MSAKAKEFTLFSRLLLIAIFTLITSCLPQPLGGAALVEAEQAAAPVVEKVLPKAAEATDKIVTVIGRYDANKILAEKIGANWLDTSMKVWKIMSPAERWERNKQWIQEAVIRGDVFQLASKITEALPGTGFAKELEYLFGIGYRVTTNGNYLYKISY